MDWYWWCLIGGGDHRRARRAADRSQRPRARGPADPRGDRRRAVRLRDPRRPGPAGADRRRLRPERRHRLRARRGARRSASRRSSASSRRRSTARSAKDPKRTVARATFIAIGLIGGFYALSSWLLANAVGPDTIVNPDALVAGGFDARRRGAGPDDRAVHHRPGPARRVLGRLRVAAVLHEPVRGAAELPQRGRAVLLRARARAACCRRAFARVSPRTGAPVIGSVAQTLIALGVVGAFASPAPTRC